MRGQLKWLLGVCAVVFALSMVFGWGSTLAYTLLPAAALLAGLYAMHFVKGFIYIWWYRMAVPWTAASMLGVLITPDSAKPLVSTILVLLFSIATLVILFRWFVLPHYRIAREI